MISGHHHPARLLPVKLNLPHLLLTALAAGSLIAPAAEPTPATAAVPTSGTTPPADTPAANALPTSGKEKKKKKNKSDKSDKSDKADKADKPEKDKQSKKDKQKDGEQNRELAAGDAKGGSAPLGQEPAKATAGNWCEWLANAPGTLYENKSNPWLQSFRIGGRLHYQAAYQDGSDMNGRDYHDIYDEYRRFRIETRTKFLRFFSAEMDVNLVNDRRFREPPDNDLTWGYDDFDTATLECDLAKAFDNDLFDDLKLSYGKMKMPITEEQRQSSKAIYTVERSLLSDKLAGAESRPTGLSLEAAKGEWSGRIGVFSGEDDADFIGAWNDGITQFYSLSWQPDKDFHLTLDYATTHQSGTDDALGYHSAVALGSTYEKKHWGTQASLVYGDNGYGDPTDNARNRANRQGDFYGMTVMPWYWLVEDRLQLVCRFEYARSEESEGLQLSSRYLRGQHDDPALDLNNGRGSRYNAWYLGLNYYLCGDNAKIMAGIQYENLAASATRKVERRNKLGGDYYVPETGTIEGFTYMVAFRSSF